MLFLYYGTDRKKVHDEVAAASKKASGKGVSTTWVTDAHSIDDLKSALQGGGMFFGKRVVILDGMLQHPLMRDIVLGALAHLKVADDTYFLAEEKIDAATKKQIEKVAEDSKKFDAPKKADGGKTIFALANALQRADKKALWVGYQRELRGSAPEAIHGVLFWAAKQMLTSARSKEEISRARKLIAELAELPHESRRKGVELEYALEKFVLASV